MDLKQSSYGLNCWCNLLPIKLSPLTFSELGALRLTNFLFSKLAMLDKLGVTKVESRALRVSSHTSLYDCKQILRYLIGKGKEQAASSSLMAETLTQLSGSASFRHILKQHRISQLTVNQLQLLVQKVITL